jgi:hypothetical protein
VLLATAGDRDALTAILATTDTVRKCEHLHRIAASAGYLDLRTTAASIATLATEPPIAEPNSRRLSGKPFP